MWVKLNCNGRCGGNKLLYFVVLQENSSKHIPTTGIRTWRWFIPAQHRIGCSFWFGLSGSGSVQCNYFIWECILSRYQRVLYLLKKSKVGAVVLERETRTHTSALPSTTKCKNKTLLLIVFVVTGRRAVENSELLLRPCGISPNWYTCYLLVVVCRRWV